MITVLMGENNFAIEQRLAGMRRHVGDDQVLVIDAEEALPGALQQAVTAQSLFVQDQTVIVRHAGSVAVMQEAVQKLLKDDVPTGVQLIIIEGKLDKRSAYYKALKKFGAEEYGPLSDGQLQAWVQQYALEKQPSATFARGADRHLLNRMQTTDQWRLASEIDKLLLLGQPISAELIDEYVEQQPAETIFELLDAALAGKSDRVLELYDSMRAQQMDPFYILSMIMWQVNAALVVKAAKDIPPRQIAKEAKLSPFVVEKLARFMRPLSLAQAKDMVHRTAQLDKQLKTSSVDADEAVLLHVQTLV